MSNSSSKKLSDIQRAAPKRRRSAFCRWHFSQMYDFENLKSNLRKINQEKFVLSGDFQQKFLNFRNPRTTTHKENFLKKILLEIDKGIEYKETHTYMNEYNLIEWKHCERGREVKLCHTYDSRLADLRACCIGNRMRSKRSAQAFSKSARVTLVEKSLSSMRPSA